jgi:hypothetical protein
VGDENRRLAAARHRSVEPRGPAGARRTIPIAEVYTPSERDRALPERLPVLGTRISKTGQKEDGARPREGRHGQGHGGIVLPKQAAAQEHRERHVTLWASRRMRGASSRAPRSSRRTRSEPREVRDDRETPRNGVFAFAQRHCEFMEERSRFVPPPTRRDAPPVSRNAAPSPRNAPPIPCDVD